MDFCHDCLFGFNTPEAYEKLIHDAIICDKTLFTRWDEVENSWKIIDPIAKYYENPKVKPLVYDVGGWGPDKSKKLIEKDGFHWRNPI